MTDQNIAPIDLVVVNLYPFGATVAKGADFATCIENIDIGGPALIRAAAKNHDHVAVVVDPEDYAVVSAAMEKQANATTLALRKRLAATAYARTGAYDGAIAKWFGEQIGEAFPRHLAVGGALQQTLRYGENPHQQAAFYTDGSKRPALPPHAWCRARSSPTTISTTPKPPMNAWPNSAARPCAIIKHANPCGVAVGADIAEGLYPRAGLRPGFGLWRASSPSTVPSTPRRRPRW